MSSLKDQIHHANTRFKHPFLKHLALNFAILVLTILFFSLLANLSWSLVSTLFSSFINLQWSILFPLLNDLLVIGPTLAILFHLKKNTSLRIYQYNDQKSEPENIRHIQEFLNTPSTSFNFYFLSIIFLSCLNYFVNIGFNQINFTFSPLNEWYYQSGFFYLFPLLPVNIFLLFVAFIIIAPYAMQHYAYRETIATFAQLTYGKNTEDQKDFSFSVLTCQVAFVLFCILASYLKTTDWTLFTYFQNSKTYTSKELLLNQLHPGCELKIHPYRSKVLVTVVKTETVFRPLSRGTSTVLDEKMHFYTTPELSAILRHACQIQP